MRDLKLLKKQPKIKRDIDNDIFIEIKVILKYDKI